MKRALNRISATFRLEALESIIKLDPHHVEALNWVAFVYLTLGKPKQASAILEPVLERHPGNYRAASYLSMASELLGRSDDLERYLRQMIDSCVEHLRHHPDDALARAFLAGALVHSGEVEAGVSQAERALTIAPDDGRIRYNVACAFARAGLTDRALAQLREGIGRTPGYFASWAPQDPDFASLREHPEFIRLFSRAD